jgi:hypothetical protein
VAISAAPFALKNLGLDAEQLRQAITALLPGGAGLVSTGDLAVTQTTTPSMGVSVGVGRAWLPGTNVSNFTGANYNKQGFYFALNDAPYTVALATADTVNPRIDLIYIGVQDKIYGAASDGIAINVVTGTPAATPAVPTLPASSIALAQVAVAANAPSVTNANITTYTGNVSANFTQTKGLMLLDQVTANSATYTSTAVVLHAIPTFTFKAGRHYRISWVANYNVTSGCQIVFQIATAATTDASTATTGLTVLQATLTANNNTPNSIIATAYYTPTTDQTLQTKFVSYTTYGSATINLTGSGTAPALYSIEDLGAQF